MVNNKRGKMREIKPQHSVRKLIIDPNNIDSSLMDEMNIDDGLRTLISQMLKHGYDTWFSCEGHENSEPYISFRKGTGDGFFEKEAPKYGLKLKKPSSCCTENKERFCGKCGASKELPVFYRKGNEPFTLYT